MLSEDYYGYRSNNGEKFPIFTVFCKRNYITGFKYIRVFILRACPSLDSDVVYTIRQFLCCFYVCINILFFARLNFKTNIVEK